MPSLVFNVYRYALIGAISFPIAAELFLRKKRLFGEVRTLLAGILKCLENKHVVKFFPLPPLRWEPKRRLGTWGKWSDLLKEQNKDKQLLPEIGYANHR
jgi:hypothetical protein